MESADCIVPAAGASERMGRWKLFLPFRGSTIVEAVVRTALAACARVILVTGFRAEELERLFAYEPDVVAVRNPAWEKGMFSSIQRGLPLVDTDRFFVALADMPLIGAEVYHALLRSPPADAVFPVFKGERGHPVLFRTLLRGAILREDPETGSMREVARRVTAHEMPWKDDSILHDVDTPEDYRRL
jgi:molybdenum cofactor cytidylyltransferase